MSASKEFTDTDLIAIYDAVNPIDDKIDFFVELARDVQAHTIIDLGCGTGLLSHELVKRGHSVIGVEPAAGMIDQAVQKYGNTAQWIVGGYETLAVPMHADMAIMTGHVAQFFLEDTAWNEALHAIRAAVKPGGCLVFESRNPLVRPFTTWPDSAGHEMIADTPLGSVEWWCEKLAYADGYATYELHYLFKESGKEIVTLNTLRFRTYEDLRASLQHAGFTIDRMYGGWDKSPFDTQSPEMVFVAKAI